jgi:type II secretory pathway predicted ATPase ExeA
MNDVRHALPEFAARIKSATKADPMYEAYFRLQRRPFSATPDPSCFFAPEPVQELFDELILRAESGQGIGILTAAAGTGKTLLCRRMAAELAARFTPIYLPNANFPTRRALLQSILFELGKRFSRLEEQELRLAVYATLKQLTLAGRGAVMIVDEAHLLNERLLEELRMLASLAEGEEPLTRLILAGQFSLEEKLAEPALAALNQRIACHACLEPLTRQQSIDYINFRIAWAGGDSARIFAPQALERIAAACNGLPRCLNQLCDHVLLLSYVQEQPRVSETAVSEALVDLRQLPQNWNTPVTDDSALLDLESGLESGDNVANDDEPESATQESTPPPDLTERGETVCFEIGGSSTEPDSLTVPNRPMAAPIPSRVAPTPGAMSGCAEENVADRYAALDVRMPRHSRTFEDASVPESWRSPRSASVPDAPRAPHSSAAPRPAGDASLDLIDDGYDTVGRTQTDDLIQGEAARPEYTSFADLDEMSHLTDYVEPELPSLEEQLRSSIVDTSQEIQSAVGGWAPGSSGWNTIESRHLPSDSIDDVVLPAEDADYDVIEPDATRSALSDGRHDRLAEDDRHASGRYIPKPKYRHVFSTLRRRLGTTLRRKV